MLENLFLFIVVFKSQFNLFAFFWLVLHNIRLTHTDLKPENILLVNSDYDLVQNKRKVCMIDFFK